MKVNSYTTHLGCKVFHWRTVDDHGEWTEHVTLAGSLEPSPVHKPERQRNWPQGGGR